MIRPTLLIPLLAVPAAAQEASYYRLAAEDLACIVTHLDTYRAIGDPAFVSTEDCPPAGETSPLDIFRNEVPTPDFADPDQLDHFLALSADDLDCLARLTLPEDAEVLRFYTGDCRIESE